MASDRCSACGTSDAECFVAGVWKGCCAACDESDRRTHPSTVPEPPQDAAPAPGSRPLDRDAGDCPPDTAEGRVVPIKSGMEKSTMDENSMEPPVYEIREQPKVPAFVDLMSKVIATVLVLLIAGVGVAVLVKLIVVILA